MQNSEFLPVIPEKAGIHRQATTVHHTGLPLPISTGTSFEGVTRLLPTDGVLHLSLLSVFH